MFKVIVNNKIVDLVGDDISFMFVKEDGMSMRCEKKYANAITGVFDGIYQIRGNNRNVDCVDFPMCELMAIERDEYDKLYESLQKEIVIEAEPNMPETETTEQTEKINLLNKINELESKLNKLLNAE